MATEAPSMPGKWVLFSKETGERFERWPIDGKAMLACGAYTRDVPGTGETAGPLPVSPGLNPASITPGVDPVPHVAAAEKALDTSPYKLMHPKAKEEPEPEAPSVPSGWMEDAVGPPDPIGEPGEEGPTGMPKTEAPAWTSSNYTPEKYLERWPNGPKADLARSIVGTD